MFRIIFALILLTEICLAQHNPIFDGGSDDGASQHPYIQEANNFIFSGGADEGSAQARYMTQMNRPIFSGGTGFGADQSYFSHPIHNAIFEGGADDGNAQQIFAMPANSSIFQGGQDDGIAQAGSSIATNNSIFAGGQDDGVDQLSFLGLPASLGPPFPIELLSFDAWPVAGKVQLQWVTSSEVNHAYFEIERSVDINTTEIVLKQTGKGGPNETTPYQAEDPQPYLGKSYYRLNSVDLDGKGEYSSWVEVYLQAPERLAVSIFPNPTTDELKVHLSGNIEGNVEIIIYDLLGRITPIKNTTQFYQGRAHAKLLLGELSDGIYLLKISDERGKLLGSYKIQLAR